MGADCPKFSEVLIASPCYGRESREESSGGRTRAIKILFCIKAMNNASGGAERVLATLASAFVRQGAAVALLTFDKPGGRSFYPLDASIRRIDLGIGSTKDSATIWTTQQRIRALRKSVKAEDPDIVIAFMHSMFIPLSLALLGMGVPMIASEHTVPEHYRTRPLEKALWRLTPYLVDRITCVSEQVLQVYPPALRRKMVVIPNPVTIAAKDRTGLCHQNKLRKILLAVGRFDAAKDHETLIKAFALIANDLNDWILRIVGDGALRMRCEALMTELGLTGRVELPGAISDISKEYSSAALFVSSSRYESFGLSTAEALIYRLPAIGFEDCPGIKELIRPGVNGLLAQGGSNRVQSLAETLKILMQNESLRVNLSQRLIDDASKYKIEAVLKKWQSLIAEVLRGYPRSLDTRSEA